VKSTVSAASARLESFAFAAPVLWATRFEFRVTAYSLARLRDRTGFRVGYLEGFCPYGDDGKDLCVFIELAGISAT
jgi:hypothetical protein